MFQRTLKATRARNK